MVAYFRTPSMVALTTYCVTAVTAFRGLDDMHGKLSIWHQMENSTSDEIILIDIGDETHRLCPEKRRFMEPIIDFGEIFIDGELSKDDFIQPSMWVEGKRCDTNDPFALILTQEKTKGSIFFNGNEFILENNTLVESNTDDLLLEDPDRELTQFELDILADLAVNVSRMQGRRFLSNALSPGEVDIFVLVDINYDVVDELGAQDSITYVLNLFSWINEHVYHPSGFNLQVSEINLRTVRCDEQSEHLYKCMQRIKEAGQPSNAHLVHHIAYTGALGIGHIGGLYTKNDWNGISACPSIKGRFSMWERICVSHELGHNFGGVHTHDTNPQVDNCGICSNGGQMDVPYGTIMSYCHRCSGGYNNIHFEFHQVTKENYLWRLYDIRQNSMNAVSVDTVGIDLGTLEPWSTNAPNNNGGHNGGIFGGGSTSSTTKSVSTSSTTNVVNGGTFTTTQRSTITEDNLDDNAGLQQSAFALFFILIYVLF